MAILATLNTPEEGLELTRKRLAQVGCHPADALRINFLALVLAWSRTSCVSTAWNWLSVAADTGASVAVDGVDAGMLSWYISYASMNVVGARCLNELYPGCSDSETMSPPGCLLPLLGLDCGRLLLCVPIVPAYWAPFWGLSQTSYVHARLLHTQVLGADVLVRCWYKLQACVLFVVSFPVTARKVRGLPKSIECGTSQVNSPMVVGLSCTLPPFTPSSLWWLGAVRSGTVSFSSGCSRCSAPSDGPLPLPLLV